MAEETETPTKVTTSITVTLEDYLFFSSILNKFANKLPLGTDKAKFIEVFAALNKEALANAPAEELQKLILERGLNFQ